MKSAFFDIDYTLYNGYLATDFNMFMVNKNYVDQSVAKSEELLLRDFKAGMIDYREAVRRALQLHADCLKGRTVAEVEAMQSEFMELNDKFFPWVRKNIKHLQGQGVKIFLISAAPLTAIQPIAAALNVANYYGTELVIDQGVYTGQIKTILNYEEKQRLIVSLLEKSPEDTHIGFGDSMGDVDMLSIMDMAVLYEPKSQELITLAEQKSWTIATEDTMKGVIHSI